MSKTFNPLVAQKLREARERAHLSQEEVATALHIRQQAYSKYETGTAGIPLRKLLKLCALLSIPVHHMLVLYEDETSDTPVTVEGN